MTGHPKPKAKPKREPKPLKRTPIQRTKLVAKRTKAPAKTNAYTQPEWRKQVARIRKRSKGVCEAQVRCGGNPVQGDPHHKQYLPLRGKKRVLVPDEWLVDCCRPCHDFFEAQKCDP